MRKLSVFLWIGVAFCSSVTGHASPQPSSAILHQRPSDPLLAKKIVARVFIFVSNDCPIANRYCPDLRRLHERFAPSGVAFWLVHSDPEETATSVQQHDREYGLKLPVLLDHDQAVARLAGAEVVPTAAVFSANGELVYRGRIDDRFAEIGRERPQASRHDLQEVLENLLAHRPVSVRTTKVIGCYIPDLH